jgi:uncharacterized phage-like protein YoqJ
MVILILYEEENPGTSRYMMEEALIRAQSEGYQFISITSHDLQVIVEEEQERNATFNDY